jgi:hypothetical protein
MEHYKPKLVPCPIYVLYKILTSIKNCKGIGFFSLLLLLQYLISEYSGLKVIYVNPDSLCITYVHQTCFAVPQEKIVYPRCYMEEIVLRIYLSLELLCNVKALYENLCEVENTDLPVNTHLDPFSSFLKNLYPYY